MYEENAFVQGFELVLDNHTYHVELYKDHTYDLLDCNPYKNGKADVVCLHTKELKRVYGLWFGLKISRVDVKYNFDEVLDKLSDTSLIQVFASPDYASTHMYLIAYKAPVYNVPLVYKFYDIAVGKFTWGFEIYKDRVGLYDYKEKQVRLGKYKMKFNREATVYYTHNTAHGECVFVDVDDYLRVKLKTKKGKEDMVGLNRGVYAFCIPSEK